MGAWVPLGLDTVVTGLLLLATIMGRNSPSQLKSRTVRIGLSAYNRLMGLAHARGTSVEQELDRLLGEDQKQLIFRIIHRLLKT